MSETRPDGPDIPQIDQTTQAASAENTVRQIGNYRLLQRIGAGGMGEVWLAEQTQPVKRRVAIKLIKTGLESREIAARFAAERQALALMNHPNIARILDAGATADGQPYFVMEWVSGKPLTQYCDDNRLGIEQRLQLFIDVCSGVQHAHQKGIIHRDLKPGNIIVGTQDGQPIPKIIDFGLAKALESTQRLTEQSLFTGIGQILGTLRYMSPEQASLDNLDIDTRSDIYALGVILYELLTGSTPLDDSSIRGQAALKVLAIIRDQEPVKPSSRLSSVSREMVSTITGQRQTDSARLRRILSGDLDWIVMKALEKDRARRYESASGFAADIRRYINSEPVAARPPSLAYRLQKFGRKNRVMVIASVLVTLALVGGLVGTRLGQLEALRQAELARQETIDKEAALAEEQRQRAEVERQRVIAERQMWRAQEAETLAEQRLVTAEKNLQFARQGNEILGAIFSDLDPTANYSEVAQLRAVLSKNLTRAVEQLQEGAVGEPLDMAKLQSRLGTALIGLGEASQAVGLFEQAAAILEREKGPRDPDTLNCWSSWALSLRELGRLPAAIEVWERIRQQMGPDPPSDLELALGVAANLADAYLASGNIESALELSQQNWELTKAQWGPDHQRTLTAMNNLAAVYRALGRTADTLALTKESYQLLKEKLGPDHPDTLGGLNNLASAYRAVGQMNRAMPLFRQVVERRSAILGRDHPDTLISINNLAVAFVSLRQFQQALPLLEETQERRTRKLGPQHPDTLMSMYNLAGVYWALKRTAEAFPLWEQTRRLRTEVLGPAHPDTIATTIVLARCYLQQQRFADVPALLETLTLHLGPDHEDTLNTMNELAVQYWTAGRPELAIETFTDLLGRQEQKLGRGHPDTQLTLANLVVNYLATNQPAEALPFLDELLVSSRQIPELAWVRRRILMVYARLGKVEELQALAGEELESVRQQQPADSLELAQTLVSVGESFSLAGQTTAALPLLREGLAVRVQQEPQAWTTFHAHSLLGAALLAQAAREGLTDLSEPLLQDAETHLLTGLEGLTRQLDSIPGPSRIKVQEAHDQVVRLYQQLRH
jgi:serine/threonine protein kinase/tetratricopeptide (TPR) repeat protein